MLSVLDLFDKIVYLYIWVLIINAVISWLIAFNILNTSNRLVYSILDTLHRICEPSIRIVRKFIPSFGNIDISPIIVFILLEFLKRLIIEYWPI